MRRSFSHSNSIKLYNFIAIVITLCLLTNCSSNAESHNLDPKEDPVKISASLSAAESLFKERSDIDKLRSAVSTLAAARNPDVRNYSIEWTFAKYSYFLGKAVQKEEEAIEIFEKGRDAARIAARVAPDKPDGHFWFAANLGELSRISPITVGIKSVDDIRESMEKVIAIEPNYQNGSAYDALGQLEMATRTLKGGSIEKAIEYFEKGIELSPDNANLRLHVAEAYLAVKKDGEAKKHLSTLIASTPHPQYVIEHTKAVEKAKDLLDKNF